MKTTNPQMRLATTAITLFLTLLAITPAQAQPATTLPSWNDSASKKAVVEFVTKVTTDKNSTNYIAPEDRIAVFDNDGTLWTEQPLYFQMLYSFERVKTLAPEHPEWKTEEPFASLMRGDLKGALAGGEPALMKLIYATQTNLTAEDFRKLSAEWVFTLKHPRFQRPYAECIYQPMLEVLDYLRANGFKIYIVTGGDAEFVRAFSQKAYGIPPEHVIGSRMKTTYKIIDDKPVIMRDPAFSFNDDGPGKPIGINEQIGRRPVIAFGNSDGDYEMLEYTTRGATGPRLGLFVHHTDAEREYAYDRGSSIGKLERGLDDASKQGWIVIDMKNDWKTIYPPAK